jgi:hypothetical protein
VYLCVLLTDTSSDLPLDQIEALRARMLEFLEVERRDFLPSIDITVKGAFISPFTFFSHAPLKAPPRRLRRPRQAIPLSQHQLPLQLAKWRAQGATSQQVDLRS